MTIGFFDTSLSFLKEYKNVVALYPQCNYVFFGDTLHGSYELLTENDRTEATTTALEFLLKKEVDTLVLGKGVESKNVMRLLEELHATQIEIVELSSLHSYIQEQTKDHIVEPESLTRTVHLTQHNKNNDEAIAQILGGFLIEE